MTQKWEPHPYLCQMNGPTHLGQEILDLKDEGAIRICLYHLLLVEIGILKKDHPSRKISET